MKNMMIKEKSPWDEMAASSQRRIDAEAIHNIFWITDLEGNYGFFLEIDELFENFEMPAKLKGISFLKRNSTRKGELFLILNKKEDWQIFHTLCEDLIALSQKYENDIAMINAIEVRLMRWQQLLKYDITQKMTLERQMGLFSELSFLMEILIPEIGLKQAINSWVGADFDKQDFLLDNAIVEIKSYRTSKGAKISISSLEQLYSDKEPLFITSYSLTTSDNGLGLNELIHQIKVLLENEYNEINDVFENKLLEYGYFPEIIEFKEYKFLIDKIRTFKVTDDFPKITPNNINHLITNVKYSIDLHYCEEFEIAIEDIFKLNLK